METVHRPPPSGAPPAGFLGRLRARGVAAARSGERHGDALIPTAPSAGGGEIPGFSRGTGNLADFPR